MAPDTKVRAVSISVVKNEADVIETMIRHNIQYLDRMVLIDNGSSDGTWEILSALQAEGLALDLRQDARLGHPQQALITDFANSDAARGAFVFPLDGDEFLSADLEAFHRLLGTMDGSFHILWRTYVPHEADRQDEPNVTRRMQRHRRRENGRFSNKVVIAPNHPRPLKVRPGSHNIAGLDLRSVDEIRLAHFPVRSPAQIAAKVLIGSWNVQLRGRTGREAWQWFDVAQQIRDTGVPSLEQFRAIGATYGFPRGSRISRTPVQSPAEFDLRYLHLARDPLLSALIQFTDRLVEERSPRPSTE